MQPHADHHAHDHDDHGHDHHGHAHGHSHGLGHSHAPANFGRAFAIGIGLNAAFVVAEVVFGLASHSVALLADAGHNLSDVLGLVVAGGAHALTRRAPTGRFTYGFGSSSILAALFNAVFLLVVIGGLSLGGDHALRPSRARRGLDRDGRSRRPASRSTGSAPGSSPSGSKGDLNLRGAFAHMLADAVVSAGVVLAGAVILLTRLALARSRGQPRRQCRHRLRHLEPAARQYHHGDGRRAARDRARRRAPLPRRAAGRRRRCTTSTSGRSPPPRRR